MKRDMTKEQLLKEFDEKFPTFPSAVGKELKNVISYTYDIAYEEGKHKAATIYTLTPNKGAAWVTFWDVPEDSALCFVDGELKCLPLAYIKKTQDKKYAEYYPNLVRRNEQP
jgi:hypothetical protein